MKLPKARKKSSKRVFINTHAPKPRAFFQDYKKVADYERSGCVWCEPMLAKEITDVEQEKYFKDDNIIVEEKFDGTRGILQFFDRKKTNAKGVPLTRRGYTRCFSRRVSVKTKWFSENTDSVPQLRDIDVPDLHGTIIDGEMFIDGQPFKAVSSTLNCLWDEAVRRQREELGNITFHAFDIIAYKGKNVENKPLSERKELLHKVIEKCHCTNLVEVPYFNSQEIEIHLDAKTYKKLSANKESYPELWEYAVKYGKLHENSLKDDMWVKYKVSRKAYYEYIVLCGGEGVILKPLDGKYYHKRGKEYMKVKKFLTREVIVTSFLPPSKVYEGKFPKDRWSFWEKPNGTLLSVSTADVSSAKSLKANGYTPVTRFFYYNQIGAIEYGVVLDADDPDTIKKFKQLKVRHVMCGGISKRVLVVGECTGFNDDEREYMTDNKDKLVGAVIEVKANELFKDTGKMRHPRFLRFRTDKDPLECNWKNHIGVD